MSTDAFEGYLERTFGDDLPLFRAHPPIPEHIRTNTLRTTPRALKEALSGYGIALKDSPLDTAFQLQQGPKDRDITGILHHFLGHFVKQSLGSMLPPLLLNPQPGDRVLDLCASPGSKTTELAALMQGQGELWANDLSGVRMNPLAARVDASSASHIIMTQGAGERLPHLCSKSFDKILVDAPCTGLGRIDQLPHFRRRFLRRSGPSGLPSIQIRLVQAALMMCKPGGRIVYSTCSLAPEEDELVIQSILERFPVQLEAPPTLDGWHWRPGRTRVDGQELDPSLRHARRLTPWQNPSEGFFAAILRKTEALGERHLRRYTPESAAELPTHEIEAPQVAPIIEKICHNYGLDEAEFAAHRFFVHKDAIFQLDPSIDSVWTGFHRVGSPLARRRGAFWRLSHTAIQRHGLSMRHNRIELSRSALSELAEHGRIPWTSAVESPYPALVDPKLGGVATLYAEAQSLRWKRAQAYLVPRV